MPGIAEIAEIPGPKRSKVAASATGSPITNESGPALQKKIAFHWVFTWNNYPANWKDFFEKARKLIEKVCVREEVCPTTGTPHLQGWLKLDKKNNAITYLTLPKQIHWEPMARNATERQNTDYCTKSAGNQLVWGIPVPWRREIKELKMWMTEVLAILQRPLEEGTAIRDVYWIWEPNGNTGKTIFQQFVHGIMDDVIAVEGKAADVKHFVADYTKTNGKTPRIIFVNIPRCDQDFISYGAIEKVKDMFFMSGKYEGGMVSGIRPHVMVFANDRPHTDKMSLDRWKIGKIVDGAVVWEG